jgi:hypothetical protein
VLLLQGLAGAAAIQQLGYNWFSFYRARGDSARQAVEATVMTVGFLGLAVPGLFVWGVWGFIGGRLATALLVLVVRRHYVRRLLGIELLSVGVRGAVPVAAAALVVGAARALTGDRTLTQAVIELVLFLAVTALATWATERRLVRELVRQARTGDRARLVTAGVASAG